MKGRVMACKPILLVEDDNELRSIMANVLESEGYKVTQAENGQIALDRLRDCMTSNSLPGCIILDLMMPVMDGKVFLETLVRDHSDLLAKISILISTAKGSPKQNLESLPVKLDSIRKPMEIYDLLRAVEKHSGKP
jgi:DNA-binding response OmpR family regulator